MSNRKTTNPSAKRLRYAIHQNAFTLVELLVVIVIIGILIGILIPAVMSAMGSAQRGSVATEIANLESAIDAFKTTYNVSYPADFSLAATDAKDNFAQKKAQVDRMLGRIFRNRIASQDIPYNVNAENLSQPVRVDFGDLDAAEALVFWLIGFTDNAQYPLTGGNVSGRFPVLYRDPTSKNDLVASPEVIDPSRSGSFNFVPTRLGDRDKDGFPEYYPAYGGEAPYVYFSSSNYQNIYLAALESRPRLPFYWLNLSMPSQGETQMQERPAPLPYLAELPDKFVTSNNSYGEKLNSIATEQTFRDFFAEPKKFQILAPGLDGKYLRDLDSPKDHPQIGDKFLSFAFAVGPYSDKAQKDNITNFAGGSLESKMP